MTTGSQEGETKAVVNTVCECGKKLTARAQHAGKQIRCPDCGQHVRLPARQPEPQDEEWAQLIDSAVSNRDRIVEEHEQARKAKKLKPASGRSGNGMSGRRRGGVDKLMLLCGVGCIAHGIIGPGISFRIVWSVVNVAGGAGIAALFMSLPGLGLLASVLVGVGFVFAGLGLLTGQSWGEALAILLSYVYIGIVAITAVVPVVVALANGVGNIEQLLVVVLKQSIPQLIVPVLLLETLNRP